MSSNTKYRSSGLHVLTLVRWVVVAVFLGSAGLSYVYLKNQLNAGGSQRKKLEQDLHDLIVQNNVLEAQIFRLTSRVALQRRLDEGFIKLVPITTQSIVRIRPQEANRWPSLEHGQENQYQTVSRDAYVRP